MSRRPALLLVLAMLLVFVPASASASPVPSLVSPVTRLLCGCDLASHARAGVVAIRSRASSVSMSIVHVLRGCHVWALGARQLGPVATVTVKPGTKLKLRVSCPMDFELRQVAGPKLPLGPSRLYQGSTRVLTFRKAGLYRFAAKNVQTSDEVGLETLGDDNALRLTIRVK